MSVLYYRPEAEGASASRLRIVMDPTAWVSEIFSSALVSLRVKRLKRKLEQEIHDGVVKYQVQYL